MVFRIRRLNAAALYTAAASSDCIQNPWRRNTALLHAVCTLGLAASRQDFDATADAKGGIARSQRVNREAQDKEPTKSAPTVRLKTAPQAERVYCRI